LVGKPGYLVWLFLRIPLNSATDSGVKAATESA
jgi:hypothetical protein